MKPKSYENFNNDSLFKSRVISQNKNLYTVFCDGVELKAEISGKFRYDAEKLSDFPTVGDFVMIDRINNNYGNAIIHYVLPRKSAFIRKIAGKTSEEQVVASNIDTVFICMSLNNDFNLKRLDRYLVTAFNSGATPVVILTKLDLCENADRLISDAEEICIGTDVIAISSLTKEGFEKIEKYISKGKTIAFVGSSGVGKSTIINNLMKQNVFSTGEIRNDDKGRHTTTSRNLVFLENGAVVIDTPGMRELGIIEDNDGMEKAFGDVESYIGKCLFSNCSHTSEKGCALLDAVRNGELLQKRVDEYLQLKSEIQYSENKTEYLLKKKIKFKNIAKINRKKEFL